MCGMQLNSRKKISYSAPSMEIYVHLWESVRIVENLWKSMWDRRPNSVQKCPLAPCMKLTKLVRRQLFVANVSFFILLLLFGPPVPIKDVFKFFFFDTLILELFKKAPAPFSAKNISFFMGSKIMPQVISPFSSYPIEIANCGIPFKKLLDSENE